MSKIYDLTHEEWVVLDHGIKNIIGQAERISDGTARVEYAAEEIIEQALAIEKTLQRPVMTPQPRTTKVKPQPAKWNPFKKKP